MSGSIFSRILRRELPGEIVYEDELAFAIRDIAPQAPVHLLVIPRQEIARLSESGDVDRDLLGHLLCVARRVAREQGLRDWRLVINDGAGAGQSVFHLHLHVIGGRPLRWPPG